MKSLNLRLRRQHEHTNLNLSFSIFTLKSLVPYLFLGYAPILRRERSEKDPEAKFYFKGDVFVDVAVVDLKGPRSPYRHYVPWNNFHKWKPRQSWNSSNQIATISNRNFSIHHFLKSHCLQFLLGHEDVPREIESNAYAKFWGVNKVYYGIWESSEDKIQTVNKPVGWRWAFKGFLLQVPEHRLRKTKETRTENKTTPNKD